ncbi:MAG: hypothetical protein ACOH2F_13315 [Cellulomonas sp.]
MDNRLRNARLLAVAALALLLFNFPFLALFGAPALVAGVPVLWVYLFAAWALVIALVRWILR